MATAQLLAARAFTWGDSDGNQVRIRAVTLLSLVFAMNQTRR